MDCPHTSFEPLAQAILRRLQAQPGHCAIRFRGTGIGTAALLDKILRLAERMPEAGITRGVRVGVCLERCPDTVVVLLALWLLGAVYVPLDPALPRARLVCMCETAELDLLLTQPALQESMSKLPCALLVLEPLSYDPAPQAPAPMPEACTRSEATALAYILFTSGSSGSPKGVMISHGNLAALFAGVLPLLDLPPGCRILACANFSFDIALFELLAPLLCGGTLVLADKQECAAPDKLLALMASEPVTLVQATPSHWQLLTALPWACLPGIAIATGEALPRSTAAAILQHASVLWNLYGPTECTLWSSAHRVQAEDLQANAPAVISIGAALPGYTLDLRETTNAEVHADACTGELVIGGKGVGAGYCGMPDAKAFACVPARPELRVYHSGDLCRRDAQGLLHYLGRGDTQIKHRGYRIELDEIALALQQHASIAQAVCLLKPGQDGEPGLLFACVVFKPGLPNKNKTSLNDFLAARLPAWMLPQRYFFLDTLPLTANGKRDRQALLKLTEPDVRARDHNSSLDNLESRVAQVFCEVLDLDSIGPCDSFLDTGGSSMLTATLVLTLNERLGSTLTLRQVLATPPTVSSILKQLGC